MIEKDVFFPDLGETGLGETGAVSIGATGESPQYIRGETGFCPIVRDAGETGELRGVFTGATGVKNIEGQSGPKIKGANPSDR